MSIGHLDVLFGEVSIQVLCPYFKWMFLVLSCMSSLFFPLIDFIYLFLERGREGEREGKKHQCVVASRVPSTGELSHNPGMCPDWELNW